MRKIYKLAGFICLGLVLSSQNTNAQTVSDFENLSLSSNSYWDGSDLSGTHVNKIFYSSFTDGDAIFQNVYDTTYGAAFASWSQGFAFSSTTDSVTAGFGNQHAARTAIGVNNSSNYGVAVQDGFNGVNPTINLTGSAANNIVSGIYITNTTYAAISMRDGDFVGKIFGDPLDANGNNDGTNGEDWFLLTIKGYTGGNLTTDSVNFYLADYRFVNNSQDYIITDWNWVDLTSLGAIDSLTFTLTSSDVGSFGMNTPAYFAFDNLNDQNVSIGELTKDLSFSVYPNPTQNKITIILEDDIKLLQVIDVTGKTIITESNISEGIHSMDLSRLKSGIYFIKLTTETQVKVERIIKK